MNIHYLQHAAGEGPGQIANWAASAGHTLTGTHWYRGDASPNPATIDFLVIMGGGMNIYQHREHPWLPAEKRLIAEVIQQGKPVLGICLGAQLIADALLAGKKILAAGNGGSAAVYAMQAKCFHIIRKAG